MTPLASLYAREAMRLIHGYPNDPGSRIALVVLAEQVPLWLRRHGLGITLRKLRELGGQPRNAERATAEARAADFLVDRVLSAPGPGHPLSLSPNEVGFGDTGKQPAYVVLSAVVRARADAFAMAAKAHLDPRGTVSPCP